MITRDRPQMSLEAFEAIARTAARHDVVLEFVGGELGVRPAPDGDRAQILAWLQRACARSRPDLWLFVRQGLRLLPPHRAGAARPDGALAPAEHFAGQGEWADSRGVLLVAEVTSFDRRADERDRVGRPRAYAESGIPIHLLVDRDSDTVTVHSEPVDGRYRTIRSYDYGERVELPGLGVVLDTEELKDCSR
ncbi:Putative restriction endonuclease [Streptomyces sp. TLI_053]|uniref:Uma2 family endonuclease n=1 Tax=Streptomyces sp. TLI_053 TaxID=1855352 RepID=UPI000879933B|nr:Uma2 family endonuclease [Streptomyces sp. TLI_053]SDT48122.1 Putative restriction endonuclease [Streptomyces sp. TLI_053]